MEFKNYISEESVSVINEKMDKKSVLKKIANLAKKSETLKNIDEESLYKKLLEREKLGSTGFGNQIAIPHCAIKGISQFVLGMLVATPGVDFDSMDKKKACVFVFIIAPEEQRNKHIRYLSAVSGILRQKEAVNEFIAAPNDKMLYQSLMNYATVHKNEKGKSEFNLIQVFIQNEEDFEEILTFFTEIKNCSLSILEANDARNYLYALPLFSNFWNDDQKAYQRLIIGIVEKSITNDLLRRINMIIDTQAGKKEGVLVMAQDLMYVNGSLNI